MVGTGPDPAEVVARVREGCRIAVLGNHDYLALRDGGANPSIEHGRAVLSADALAWMRSRKPAASVRERAGATPGEPAARVVAQLWHGGPHNAVHEFVGPRNARDCLAVQRAPIGLVGHTHVPAAFHDRTRKVTIIPGEPLDISEGKWLLNPGAVGAPHGSLPHTTALWLLLDLHQRTAPWMAEPFDPGPAAERARRLGFEL